MAKHTHYGSRRASTGVATGDLKNWSNSGKAHKKPDGRGGSPIHSGFAGHTHNEGERTHKHAFAGHSVHDQHLKHHSHNKPHIQEAVAHLNEQHYGEQEL